MFSSVMALWQELEDPADDEAEEACFPQQPTSQGALERVQDRACCRRHCHSTTTKTRQGRAARRAKALQRLCRLRVCYVPWLRKDSKHVFESSTSFMDGPHLHSDLQWFLLDHGKQESQH